LATGESNKRNGIISGGGGDCRGCWCGGVVVRHEENKEWKKNRVNLVRAIALIPYRKQRVEIISCIFYSVFLLLFKYKFVLVDLLHQLRIKDLLHQLRIKDKKLF